MQVVPSRRLQDRNQLMSKHPIWQAKSPTVVASSSFGEEACAISKRETRAAKPWTSGAPRTSSFTGSSVEGADITSFIWDVWSAVDAEFREPSWLPGLKLKKSYVSDVISERGGGLPLSTAGSGKHEMT